MFPTTPFQIAEARRHMPLAADGSPTNLTLELLAEEHRQEVLDFLAERPVHTVYMAGLVRDNGVVSRANRGSFHACRDSGTGRLEGVALVGHATLVEARREEALIAFARLARRCASAHLIRVEQEQAALFWRHYVEEADGVLAPRRVCRELLLELRPPVRVRESVPGLRLAAPSDVENVMLVNGAMAFDEGGVNPLVSDAEGFRLRTLRRIAQGRVWVWVDDGRLVFKADILAETPEAVYLEGVYVRADERGKGHGTRCLSQLGRALLRRAGAVCLAVNERQRAARAFYAGAGFEPRGAYDTIYLRLDDD